MPLSNQQQTEIYNMVHGLWNWGTQIHPWTYQTITGVNTLLARTAPTPAAAAAPTAAPTAAPVPAPALDASEAPFAATPPIQPRA